MVQPDAAPTAREPVRRRRVWVLIAAMVLLGVPWYLPAGTIAPFVFGVPAWFWMSVFAAVGLSATVCWACLTQWRLEEVEDTRNAGAAAGVDDERGEAGR